MPLTRRASRFGFTLPEMIVALVICMIVIAPPLALVSRHIRADAAQRDVTSARARLNEAGELMALDLRSMSPAIDSVKIVADTSIEFGSVIGASTVCAATPGRIIIPPDSLTGGRILSSWVSIPDSDDVVAVVVDSTADHPIRSWENQRIASVATASTAAACPPSLGLTTAADVAAGVRSYQITLESARSTITAGAPLRLLRRVKYDVYRAGDGNWYLGYRRCGRAGCGGVQPLSGPFAGAAGGTPLSFRYFDTSGTRITGATIGALARVDIVSRVVGRATSSLRGARAAPYRDSVTVSAAIRNRE